MILDFITGIIVSVIQKKTSSRSCAKGIAKKVLMLFIVIMAHIIDTAIIGNGETVRNIVICFYLSNEGISLLENSAALGVKYPDKLIKILNNIQNHDDGGSIDGNTEKID